MACASSGDIELSAMITSSSVSPFNEWVTPADYERMVNDRNEMIKIARDSGFQNIPDPVRGTKGHLVKPASGDISQTQPIGSDGTYRIIEESRKTGATRPIVAVMCGPLTVLADAYLMDPSVANNVTVAWFGGSTSDMSGYNGSTDPWAAYIVLKRFSVVQFPEKTPQRRFAYSPIVRKERLIELPDTPLRKWMIDKKHPNGAPGYCDADAPPAISVMRPKYALRRRRVTFSHWENKNGRDIPAYKSSKHSNTLVVEMANREAATKEWWRALKNTKAYHPQPLEIPR